jgi:hypothetical protein
MCIPNILAISIYLKPIIWLDCIGLCDIFLTTVYRIIIKVLLCFYIYFSYIVLVMRKLICCSLAYPLLLIIQGQFMFL